MCYLIYSHGNPVRYMIFIPILKIRKRLTLREVKSIWLFVHSQMSCEARIWILICLSPKPRLLLSIRLFLASGKTGSKQDMGPSTFSVPFLLPLLTPRRGTRWGFRRYHRVKKRLSSYFPHYSHRLTEKRMLN